MYSQRRLLFFIFPALLAIFPILSLYGTNLSQVTPIIVALPLAVTFLTCFIVWALSAWFFHSGQRGALMCGGIFLLSNVLGPFFSLADETMVGKYLLDQDRVVWGALVVLALILWGRYLKHTRHVFEIALILTVSAAGFLVLPVSHIVTRETIVALRTAKGALNQRPLSPATCQRDIYYIILDGYARQDVLRDIYGYDNGAFIQFLRSKGFYVADKARSNYGFTLLSLASSLNFNYLDGLSLNPQQEAQCADRLLHNQAMNFLKSHGYKIVHFSSGWVVTGTPMPQATSYFTARSLNKFNIQLLKASLLRLVILDQFEYATQAEYIRYNLHMAREMPLMEGPKFVFIHIVSPHPPFLFDRDGHLVVRSKKLKRLESDWLPKDSYVNQLQYITSEIQSVVTAILERSKIEPIILLQSDHGPALPGLTNRPDPEIVYARSSILDTFYLPGVDYKKWLHPTMTPVNSFRTVFNAYFNAGYPILPDKTYFSGPIGASPYEFQDVTDMKR